MSLLVTNRHTQKDLEFWRDLEQADLVHADRAEHRKLVKTSGEAITKFVSEGPCYLGISWGKDSVACAHLLWTFCRDQIPLFHIIEEPGENPYNTLVKESFLNQYPMSYHEVIANYRWVTGVDHEVDHQTDLIFLKCFRDFKIQRHISGVRRGESGGRAIRMARFGLTTPNSLAPIGNWRLEDVYAYLAKNNLPVHPNYGMLGGGRWPREKLRVSRVGGMPGRGFGRLEWEKEYYGDLLRRMGN